MKLTTAQRSEIISEPASSDVGFNELVRILLNRFSKQERAFFLDEHKGEQGNDSALVFGVARLRLSTSLPSRSLGCFSTDHTRDPGCSGKRAYAAFHEL